MSSSIQPLTGIKPIDESTPVAAPPSPAQKEYEEGKQALEKGEHGAAAVALHNALLAFDERGDQAGIANAHNQLGHLCLARDEYEKAGNHYRRALEICDRANDRMSVLAVSDRLVEVCLGLADSRGALAHCLEMLDIYQDNRDPQGSVAVLEKMADIYLAAGDREKAADALQTIASLHRNFGHTVSATRFAERAEEVLAKV